MKKAIFIVVGLIVLSASGFALYSSRKGDTKAPVTYKTQQECEIATGRTCNFVMCDYKCDVGYKGWLPKE